MKHFCLLVGEGLLEVFNRYFKIAASTFGNRRPLVLEHHRDGCAVVGKIFGERQGFAYHTFLTGLVYMNEAKIKSGANHITAAHAFVIAVEITVGGSSGSPAITNK